jgi:DNA gyrase subunit A
MDVVTTDDQKLLVISEKGYGKITKSAHFPSHKRGGVGIKAAVVTAKTGPIITVQSLEEDANEALLISQNGQTIRVALKDIPTLGRTTQGVRVMRLSDGDAVSSIGIMQEAKDEDVEDDENQENVK